ncbi:MRPS16 [Sanghuangporus sanghuang]
MVVRIRFSMHGPRHDKFFRIVAINSKQRRDAKPIETLGVFRHTIDPAKDRTAKSVEWSVARIKYWLGVGAQPSKSAVRLFTQGGILPPDSKYHPSPKRRQVSSEEPQLS